MTINPSIDEAGLTEAMRPLDEAVLRRLGERRRVFEGIHFTLVEEMRSVREVLHPGHLPAYWAYECGKIRSDDQFDELAERAMKEALRQPSRREGYDRSRDGDVVVWIEGSALRPVILRCLAAQLNWLRAATELPERSAEDQRHSPSSIGEPDSDPRMKRLLEFHRERARSTYHSLCQWVRGFFYPNEDLWAEVMQPESVLHRLIMRAFRGDPEVDRRCAAISSLKGEPQHIEILKLLVDGMERLLPQFQEPQVEPNADQ